MLNKNLYGGLCVRGNRAWLERHQGDFLTSEGKIRGDGNHTRPNWVDLWGKLDGKPSGIVSFCHPGNFRAPQPVRLHPTETVFVLVTVRTGRFCHRAGRAVHVALPFLRACRQP